jgi:hypothetical protein
MKAGKTDCEVDTKIRITFIEDEEDKSLEGYTGTLTHIFSGFINPDYENDYLVGVHLDKAYGNYLICNLMKGDKYEVIKDDNQ